MHQQYGVVSNGGTSQMGGFPVVPVKAVQKLKGYPHKPDRPIWVCPFFKGTLFWLVFKGNQRKTRGKPTFYSVGGGPLQRDRPPSALSTFSHSRFTRACLAPAARRSCRRR